MNYHFSHNLDQDKLTEFYDGDPLLATGVFEAFIQETTPALTKLNRLFESGEREEFRRLVHKIKPGFLYVGLTPLFEQMTELEQRCSAVSDVSELRSSYEQVKNDLLKGMPIIEEELARLKAH